MPELVDCLIASTGQCELFEALLSRRFSECMLPGTIQAFDGIEIQYPPCFTTLLRHGRDTLNVIASKFTFKRGAF